MKSEKKLQKACEQYLDRNKITYLRIYDKVYEVLVQAARRGSNPGVYSVLKKLKGIPDLNILFPNGTYVCVELKSDTGVQSKEQKLFEKKVGTDNYYVVRTVKGFTELISKYQKQSKKDLKERKDESN